MYAHNQSLPNLIYYTDEQHWHKLLLNDSKTVAAF